MENRSERVHTVLDIAIGVIGIVVTTISIIVTIISIRRTKDKK